ncbi:MAG: HAD family hydrolase [Ruminococcaceae bacterium]|nr:HAD family hydrolase [Oscillospiraceae bacterium]
MQANVIIFDKDGTLIQFDDFWVSITEHAIRDILKKINREDIPHKAFFDILGVKNGKADVDGILCVGSFEEMGEAFNCVLRKYNCTLSSEQIVSLVTKAYEGNIEKGIVKAPCPDIVNVMSELKAMGKKLLVATADNTYITSVCLKKLCIENFFDKVYTSDQGFPAKPNPHCILKYCQETGISPDDMVMVGDTMNDIIFARNAGIKVIVVGKTKESRELLESCADAFIPDISFIFDVIK